MNRATAYRRKDCLQRVQFWLRSCNEESAIASPGLTQRYISFAREAMDELMLDMFGDEQESEKEGVA